MREVPAPSWRKGRSITDESARHAARHGMNMLSLGPIQLVKRVTAVYHEHVKESVNSRQNVNTHVSRPKIGVTRHIYIANTDRRPSSWRASRPERLALLNPLREPGRSA